MNSLNRLTQAVTSHLGFLIYYLNPLVTENSSKFQGADQSQFNGNSDSTSSHLATEFLLPITALVGSLLYGTLYLVYAAEGALDLEKLKSSPAMIYHQIVPPAIWHQLDVAAAFANCTVVAIFCAFLAKRAGFTAGRYWVKNTNGEDKDKDKKSKRGVEVSINGQSKCAFT